MGVYTACDGARSVAESKALSTGAGGDTAIIISSLMAVGFLTLEDAQADSGEVKSASRPLLLDRGAVSAKMAEVAEGTYFDVLGVSKGASGDEVARAYRAFNSR